MPGALRVALFVEGSQATPRARGFDPLVTIWNEHLAQAAGIQAFDSVIPISKRHLVAMDPKAPSMSGAGERLDQLMVRMQQRRPFDAAVVAWDLVPAWNPAGSYCRRNETVDLYRLLAASTVLPTPWRQAAEARHLDLTTRAVHHARPAAPRLGAHMVLALCMEPMFEAVLVQHEQSVRRALDLAGQPSPSGWPSAGWGPSSTRPDSDVLVPAVASLRRVRPAVQAARQVPGDFRTNKNGWAEYILRRMLSHDVDSAAVRVHPICRRMAEWLA